MEHTMEVSAHELAEVQLETWSRKMCLIFGPEGVRAVRLHANNSHISRTGYVMDYWGS